MAEGNKRTAKRTSYSGRYQGSKMRPVNTGRRKSTRVRRKIRRKRLRELVFRLSLGVLMVGALVTLGRRIISGGESSGNQVGAEYAGEEQGTEESAREKRTGPRQNMEEWPDIDVQLIDVSEWSRPGIAMKEVKGVVVHYTANPGASGQANRDYFNNLKKSHTTKASCHFVVGLKGEIIQLIPCSEISYASNQRNGDTLAIECCIPDESAVFTEKTYDTLVELTAWLVCRYSLTVENVIRHYDVTGKNCPKDYVEHPEKWEAFLADVQTYIDQYS